MNRLKWSMHGWVFAIVLTPLLLTADVARTAPLTCETWKVVSSPNPGSGGNYLSGAAAVSTNNVWAVGDYTTSTGIIQTLIEHWNGSSWQLIPSPNVGPHDNYLSGAAAVSTNNVWAMGDYLTSSGTPRTLIEHWNGTSWKVVPSPNGGGGGALSGVAVVSASDVCAVGSSSAQTLTEHWNGTSWQVVPSPNVPSTGNLLNSVAVVSAHDVWAVGDYLNADAIPQTLIEQWNGSSWQVVSSPNVGDGGALSGVAVVSASGVWAVGSNSPQTVAEHWNGSSWQVVPSPNPSSGGNLLNGVAAVSTNNVWAVGDYLTGSAIARTLIEYWNGSSWKVVPSPNPSSLDNHLTGVARIPGSSNVWAVGDSYMSNRSSRTLAEFYC